MTLEVLLHNSHAEPMLETPTGLELEMLRPETRNSAARLDELLDDSFFEFGQSGKFYQKRDVVEALLDEGKTGGQVALLAKDIDERELSEDLVLVTYRCEAISVKTGQCQWASLRSSIWKKTRQGWRLLFHQGTSTR